MNEYKLRILKPIVHEKSFHVPWTPEVWLMNKYMIHLFTKITLLEAKGLWTELVWFETISVLSSWVSEEYEVRCLLLLRVKSQWDFDRDKWSLWLIGVLWETLPLHSTPAQLWNWNTEILWNRNTHETRNTHDWDFSVPPRVMNITLFETKTLFTRTLSLESVTSSFLIYEVNWNYFILWNVDMRRSSFCIPCFDLSMRKIFWP